MRQHTTPRCAAEDAQPSAAAGRNSPCTAPYAATITTQSPPLPDCFFFLEGARRTCCSASGGPERVLAVTRHLTRLSPPPNRSQQHALPPLDTIETRPGRFWEQPPAPRALSWRQQQQSNNSDRLTSCAGSRLCRRVAARQQGMAMLTWQGARTPPAWPFVRCVRHRMRRRRLLALAPICTATPAVGGLSRPAARGRAAAAPACV